MDHLPCYVVCVNEYTYVRLLAPGCLTSSNDNYSLVVSRMLEFMSECLGPKLVLFAGHRTNAMRDAWCLIECFLERYYPVEWELVDQMSRRGYLSKCTDCDCDELYKKYWLPNDWDRLKRVVMNHLIRISLYGGESNLKEVVCSDEAHPR